MNQASLGDLGTPVGASSVVALLYALRHAGFRVDRIPRDGHTLVAELLDAVPLAPMRRWSRSWAVPHGVRLDLGNVLVTVTASDSRGATIASEPGLLPALNTGRRLAEDWGADAVVHLGGEVLLQWLPQADSKCPTLCRRHSLGDPVTVVDVGDPARDRHDRGALVLALSPPVTQRGQLRSLPSAFTHRRTTAGPRT